MEVDKRADGLLFGFDLMLTKWMEGELAQMKCTFHSEVLYGETARRKYLSVAGAGFGVKI